MIRKPADMRSEVREKMRGGPGSITFRHYFDPAEFGAKVRLCTKLIIPPGAGIGTHQHAAEDEIFIITAGTGLLDDGNSKTTVTAGDAILTGKGGSHAIANTGKDNLEIIAVIMCYS
jgi:mannose-6-phosphate isomerase-like protein (cupin superfamily)